MKNWCQIKPNCNWIKQKKLVWFGVISVFGSKLQSIITTLFNAREAKKESYLEHQAIYSSLINIILHSISDVYHTHLYWNFFPRKILITWTKLLMIYNIDMSFTHMCFINFLVSTWLYTNTKPSMPWHISIFIRAILKYIINH